MELTSVTVRQANTFFSITRAAKNPGSRTRWHPAGRERERDKMQPRGKKMGGPGCMRYASRGALYGHHTPHTYTHAETHRLFLPAHGCMTPYLINTAKCTPRQQRGSAQNTISDDQARPAMRYPVKKPQRTGRCYSTLTYLGSKSPHRPFSRPLMSSPQLSAPG